jgi:hypothetical protein
MTVTNNWNDFGHREIADAKELLSHIKSIDSYGKVEVQFNTMSGCVFLVDEDYKVWMMNGDGIEEWHNCPECGHEGFLEDMEHDGNFGCFQHQQAIGVTEECDKHYEEYLPSDGCPDCKKLPTLVKINKSEA